MTDIAQARERLAEIQAHLSAEIQRQLDGFKQQFGIAVSSIQVNMIDVTDVSSASKERKVSVNLCAELSPRESPR